MFSGVGDLPGKYHVITSPVSWTAAESACAAMQLPASTMFTHLAVIDDEHERSVLHAVFANSEQWIGLSDRAQEGLYLWVTNGGAVPPASGSPWASQQPASDQSLDCVDMDMSSDYRVAACSDLRIAWCECDAMPVNPLHTP
jgi:hypothetical protein